MKRREEKRQEIKEKKKCYREKTKVYFDEPFDCLICGGKYTRRSQTTHCKTKKHQQALQQES